MMMVQRGCHGLRRSENHVQTLAALRINDMLFEQFALPDDHGQLIDQVVAKQTMRA